MVDGALRGCLLELEQYINIGMVARRPQINRESTTFSLDTQFPQFHDVYVGNNGYLPDAV